MTRNVLNELHYIDRIHTWRPRNDFFDFVLIILTLKPTPFEFFPGKEGSEDE